MISTLLNSKKSAGVDWKMNDFFEKHIIIETDRDITIEDENEIFDLVKQVLRRKPRHENRDVRLITGFTKRED